jgi:hypothetical protein
MTKAKRVTEYCEGRADDGSPGPLIGTLSKETPTMVEHDVSPMDPKKYPQEYQSQQRLVLTLRVSLVLLLALNTAPAFGKGAKLLMFMPLAMFMTLAPLFSLIGVLYAWWLAETSLTKSLEKAGLRQDYFP